MASQANQTAVMARLYDQFQWVNENADDLTTQEKAWLLLAMAAITQHRAPVAIDMNGQKLTATDHAITLNPTPADLAKGIAVTNDAGRDLWESVSIQGISATPLPATASGISLIREYWTLDGKPADLSKVMQNDRLIVTLARRHRRRPPSRSGAARSAARRLRDRGHGQGRRERQDAVSLARHAARAAPDRGARRPFRRVVRGPSRRAVDRRRRCEEGGDRPTTSSPISCARSRPEPTSSRPRWRPTCIAPRSRRAPLWGR